MQTKKKSKFLDKVFQKKMMFSRFDQKQVDLWNDTVLEITHYIQQVFLNPGFE